MAEQDKVSIERDLRLDLFRGVGLWMIFLDHIPHDVVSWLTLRNYGFSDAAEFFVFISGYLAGFIYGPIIKAGYFLSALKRLWKRAMEMYVAHIMLFLIFTAQIARTVRRFDNPLYEDEFNVHNFLLHPDILIGQALTLRYKPVNLDVLPLYITLIATAPFMLWAMVRRPNLTLLASIVLYIFARIFDWNFASYPPGSTWYFNPFAWQLMFIFAAWCGTGGANKIWPIVQSRLALAAALLWILFAFMFRFTHFLALALVVARFVPHNWSALKYRWLRPAIMCGRHSLPIFCFGVFLSFAAHWVLMQYTRGVWEQLVVSAAGILAMVGIAWLLDRAADVPDLFVEAAEVDGGKAALESGKA
jgi:hypothetical protein